MPINNSYGLSLWAYRESKSPAIFEAFAEVARADSAETGGGDPELVALIDDRTSRDYSGRTEEEQLQMTGRYIGMLQNAGFNSIHTYSALPIGRTTSEIIEVMRAIPAPRYYNSILPPHKRDNPSAMLSEIFITSRETDMLVYGANELKIGNFMFGRPAENFARWFKECNLLKSHVRTIIMDHI